jgi:hypothetical protein
MFWARDLSILPAQILTRLAEGCFLRMFSVRGHVYASMFRYWLIRMSRICDFVRMLVISMSSCRLGRRTLSLTRLAQLLILELLIS